MSIVESIKKARESGQADDQILSEIIRQNEEKAPVLKSAKERGVSSTDIINEIIEQNSSSEKLYTKEMQEKENEEREDFLRKMDSRDKNEPLKEEVPPPPEPKPIPGDDPYTEEIPESPQDSNEFENIKSEFPAENNFAEQFPEKPKEEDKLWVRVTVVLSLVAVVAVVCGFFYWALILKPPVAERDVIRPILVEKEIYIPRAPKPLIKINPAIDDVLRYPISTTEEYRIILRDYTKKKLNSHLTHLVVEDHRSTESRIINLEDFVSLFSISFPSDFFNLIEKDFTFVVYEEGEENRFAFVSRIKEGEERGDQEKNRENFEWMIMRPWESTIERSFQSLFSFMGASMPSQEDQLLQKEYKSYKVRYRESPRRDRDVVVVTTSLSAAVYSNPAIERGTSISSLQRDSRHLFLEEAEDFYRIILKEEILGEENCLSCPMEYTPACGEDEKTYLNSCFAECNNIEITEEGKCEEDINLTGWIPKTSANLLEKYKEDIGIYYTITSNRFIFAMSFEGVKTIIDRL